MKGGFMIIVFSCMVFAANAQLRVKKSGEVSVKSNLKVEGHIEGVLIGDAVSGNVVADGGSPVAGTFAGLKAIPYYNDDSTSRTRYALAADCLERVYPELVFDRGDGTKGIDYVGLIPLLVQAIGELNERIAVMGNAGGGMKAPVMGSVAGMGNAMAEVPDVRQNVPNPFADVTSIEVVVPETAGEAFLYIYDMSGKQVRRIAVAERGRMSVSVTSEGLAAGMYLYSLIVDGRIVGTRRMVLAG